MKANVARVILIVALALLGLAWLVSKTVGLCASYYKPRVVFTSAASAGGTFFFSVVLRPPPYGNPTGLVFERHAPSLNSMYDEQSGYLPFLASFSPYGVPGFMVFIPYWLLILLTSLALVWAHTRIRRRRDAGKARLCASCGYNLTGNVSGTCPECGQRLASHSA